MAEKELEEILTRNNFLNKILSEYYEIDSDTPLIKFIKNNCSKNKNNKHMKEEIKEIEELIENEAFCRVIEETQNK